MNEENRESSRVGSLEDSLYSRTRYKNPLDQRSPLRESGAVAADVPGKWQSPELNEILTRERVVEPIHPFMKKFFIFALLFFTATILVAGVIFLGGTNFISSKNVDIEVVGPTNASAGEILELGITIANKNNTDLVPANFSIQYPAGSRDPEDTAKSLTFSKTDLGIIKAGDEVARSLPVVLIGTEGEIKEFKFSVEYKVKGSNATFYKDKIYQVTIGEAPMSISVESPPRVESGGTFSTKVRIKYSASQILKNVMLRAEYPYGYSSVSATPEAASDNNVWVLGDFSPGTEKVVEIRGRLVGENQDERTFRFYAGVSDNGSLSGEFKSIIVSTQNTVALERPAIGLNISFNGDASPTYVAPAERSINTSIKYQNNLPDKITNPRLEVRLSGNALDKGSIRVQGEGFYDSGANSIVWALSNSFDAAELLPGQDGAVSFSFSSLPLAAIGTGSRDINFEIILSGTPVGGRTISIKEARTVKIASQVSFTSRAYHSIGPFKNTGPIPPKVEATTTYAVVWNIGNTQDDISEAKVTARLGPGVKISGVQNAGADDFSYNEANNTVVWNLGNLSSGSGFSTSGKEMAFQVSLVPSLSQLGTAPVLVTGIIFSGRDVATGNTVALTSPPLTTRLQHDPAFIQGDDVVRR